MDRQVPAITMEDELGIVYLVENAQQFWSELEDILDLPKEPPTLQQLDSTLRRSVSLCAVYHEQYLQSPLQLEHACHLLLDSELFAFHSERMCDLLIDDAQSTTDPHLQLIIYSILHSFGTRRTDFFRFQKRWTPLIPLLMDHVLVEIDADVEDIYFGTAGSHSNGNHSNFPVPIEAKLRDLSVQLLYEVCRVQKLSVQDLRMFDDTFLDYLLDLVEQTRYMQDDTFNYSVIKLIVALNEKFMVATIPTDIKQPTKYDAVEPQNRVLSVLMRRLGSSKTFGENMIFMLNRAQRTSEDLCMQLLVLKLLYLLFSTPGTSEYFYTNDLCVLVDVFLRDLVDLDEENESLRHTYLRVLHPLLTKTQLRDIPYKRPQIVYTLESLISHSKIRDINATTKRLVERCLTGDWCVKLRRADVGNRIPDDDSVDSRLGTPSIDGASTSSDPQARSQLGITSVHASSHLDKHKALKSSRSMEFSKPHIHSTPQISRSVFEGGRPTNSTVSLVAISNPSPHPSHRLAQRKGTVNSAHVEGTFADRRFNHQAPGRSEQGLHDTPHVPSTASASSIHGATPKDAAASLVAQNSSPQRRSAPPPPSKRRKPPAIPVGRTNGGATITTIRSSVSSPLTK